MAADAAETHADIYKHLYTQILRETEFPIFYQFWIIFEGNYISYE